MNASKYYILYIYVEVDIDWNQNEIFNELILNEWYYYNQISFFHYFFFDDPKMDKDDNLKNFFPFFFLSLSL